MTDRPIIFSAPMVRALLDGRKNQTRRVLHPQPQAFPIDDQGTPCDVGLLHVEGDLLPRVTTGRVITRQEVRFAIADRLWVREAVARTPNIWAYKADSEIVGWPGRQELAGKTRDSLPSIFMPRSASRLTLTVTDVRVQRLSGISEEDAVAEGVECDSDGWRDYAMPTTQCCARASDSFRTLWNTLHGPEAWTANPWVVALTFTVEQQNINQLRKLDAPSPELERVKEEV